MSWWQTNTLPFLLTILPDDGVNTSMLFASVGALTKSSRLMFIASASLASMAMVGLFCPLSI